MTWVREGIADYEELTGGGIVTHGRFGKAVKVLVDRDGWEQVQPAWRHFLQVMRHTLSYATPEYFARTYPQWLVKPTHSLPSPQWEEYQDGLRLRVRRVPPDDRPAA